jgi:hypothetical protein
MFKLINIEDAIAKKLEQRVKSAKKNYQSVLLFLIGNMNQVL